MTEKPESGLARIAYWPAAVIGLQLVERHSSDKRREIRAGTWRLGRLRRVDTLRDPAWDVASRSDGSSHEPNLLTAWPRCSALAGICVRIEADAMGLSDDGALAAGADHLGDFTSPRALRPFALQNRDCCVVPNECHTLPP